MRTLIACLLFAMIIVLLGIGIAESRDLGLTKSYACWDRCPFCGKDAHFRIMKFEEGPCRGPYPYDNTGEISVGIYTCDNGHKWECIEVWGPTYGTCVED